VDANERQTALIFRTLHNTARVFRNRVADQVLEIESRPGATDFADLQPLVAGVRGRDQVLEGGDTEAGIWTAGQVIGLIHDIPSCAELIQRMMKEARDGLRQQLKVWQLTDDSCDDESRATVAITAV
jgi:NADH:quinone reductase (non-electrogenic)